MEDFEYSVEISDRDWDCFFAECEECNLLPPSLAGLEDSGMSDMDDTGPIHATRVQKVDLEACFSEADNPIDGPPDCEGSPVEHYLSKHGIGGMESVLSGSEEDIHLQCVNIFFEKLKNVTEAERLTEPSQVRAQNTEPTQEEEWCRDGQQASTALPKNIPKLNSLPARGETAAGKETMEPVDTISNLMKTMRKDQPGSNISPEPAASDSVLKTNKSAHHETKLFIIEEACTAIRVNEAAKWSQLCDAPDGIETTLYGDKVIKVERCTPVHDVKQEGLLTSQLTLGKKCSTDSGNNLEMLKNVKRKEDPHILESDTESTNKTASQESSPSASIKRKRRKKRRLSVESAESVHGCERQAFVKPSDSEERQYGWRGGTGVSDDINLFCSNEPQKNLMSSLTTYSATSNPSVKISAQEIKVNDSSNCSSPCYSQHQELTESVVRQGRCKATGSTEITAAHDTLSQSDDSVISTSNYSGNVAENSHPCKKLQIEDSAEMNKHSGLPVSIFYAVTGKPDLYTGTAICGRKDALAGTVRQSDKLNHSIVCCENVQSCTAEVKSPTLCILPSVESNDPTEEVSQNENLSTAKSVLAGEAGNTCRDHHTLCQRDAEAKQQLEIDCHYKDQYSSKMEKTGFPLSANGMSTLEARNTKPQQFKSRAHLVAEEISTVVDCPKLTLDPRNSLPVKCLSESTSGLVNQTEHPLVCRTLSRFDVLSTPTIERAELAGSQIMAFNSENPTLTPKGETETKSSMSEDLITTPSDITPISSCCTLDTESLMSLSNENITDKSGSSCLPVSQNESRLQEETTLMLAKHDEEDGLSGPKNQSVSNDTTDSGCDLVLGCQDAITASKAECNSEKAPDSKHSVFAISSFWNEMEKLTINDILGLRMISRAAPPGSLLPLQESEESDGFSMSDSGFFTQLDESKPEQANEDTSSILYSLESSSGSVSSGITWESEPIPVNLGADIYTENMMLTSVGDSSQRVLPGSAQTGLRKISKNVSVHNLHALESVSYPWKGQTLQTLDEGDLEKVDYFTDGHMPNQDQDIDCSASSSLTDNYRISLGDIFQYIFGGKQPNPSQPAAEKMSSYPIEGNSVPETYDHFFSEFDTESFFYPFVTATYQAKDELVPVFSYSRSANRNLQFPEAYDHFFASSSSDDSSVESDEEDNCGPVRVVNRLKRTSSASKISTDIYENFFTNRDLGQNFFWKNTFSFRNIRITRSTEKTLSNSLVPVRQGGRSLQRTVHPVNALGNQDLMISDPLLYHLEDRISRQLAQQPFRYEDLQTAVSNPRLDAPFLPLKQSDMCLVCIAFASWVLKTANPQVGDAWKAVLLANVSALSAIRYLRKYIKVEAAASERKLHLTSPSDS